MSQLQAASKKRQAEAGVLVELRRPPPKAEPEARGRDEPGDPAASAPSSNMRSMHSNRRIIGRSCVAIWPSMAKIA